MAIESLHILVCPLDWGLGHATRCVPIIHELVNAGHKVVIAGSGRSMLWLKQEFPLIERLDLQGFSPRLTKKNTLLRLILQLPLFIKSILKEHSRLKELISIRRIDILISDNRYGLWNPLCKSIIITHQVMFKTPVYFKFAEYFFYLFSKLLLNKFDECWIPDMPQKPGLSGDLSHKYKLPENARFIGPLSRFKSNRNEHSVNKEGILAIVSGPEPQRRIFEELLTDQLSAMNIKATIATGKPESGNGSRHINRIKIIDNANTNELEMLIKSSELVICRSGYSSIMDISALGAKALFVPTPGQTEQEYLAELHKDYEIALCRKQSKLELSKDVKTAKRYKGFDITDQITDIKDTIMALKKK